jgi:hypothetical protein
VFGLWWYELQLPKKAGAKIWIDIPGQVFKNNFKIRPIRQFANSLEGMQTHVWIDVCVHDDAAQQVDILG